MVEGEKGVGRRRSKKERQKGGNVEIESGVKGEIKGKG